MPIIPSTITTATDLGLDGGEKRCTPVSSIPIQHVIRTMRGGSQSRLVQCAGGFYVAKFLGNPQGNRTLINELVSHRIIEHLGISTPTVQLLELPPDQEVFFQMGSDRVLPQAGPHFGSRCAADPEKKVIFDFLPRRLLSKILNIEEFATMFAVDRWLYNTDRRQAVYTRAPAKGGKVVFKASFIDNGNTFGGQEWQFHDAPLHGIAFDISIYSLIDMRALTRIAVERIQAITTGTLQSAADGVPDTWLAPGDHARLSHLLNELSIRRRRLGSMIARHLVALKL